MENEIKFLKNIVDKKYSKRSKRKKVLVYLSVCFLGIDGNAVAGYFKIKYTKVRHFITVCGLKLRRRSQFMKEMHEIAKDYNNNFYLKSAS